MKKLIIITSLSATAIVSARAQWVVYDPTLQAQNIIDTAQEIAQFVTMVNNQVSQIQTLTSQLNEFKNYESLFGNPQNVLLSAVAPLVSDLGRAEVGVSLGGVVSGANGANAMNYNNNGLYFTVGSTFQTPRGTTVSRDSTGYKPFAAVNAATANYQTVSTNSAARRVALKEQIATTVEALSNATTDAEVQKLNATLGGLSAALSGTGQETSEAVGTALVQDIENRNDRQKQGLALQEQQTAAFSEAVVNYGKTFQILDAPTTFPK
jgi:hypothetical protein